MLKRTCDACGEYKEVRYGKVCQKGHFICSKCINVTLLPGHYTKCPICNTKLK
jgi:hypothetical protein